jgi:hypothetical protein
MAQYVGTKFRKHPLSFFKGGGIVITLDIFGKSKVFDKIKYPKQYIDAILDNSEQFMDKIYFNNELMWTKADQQHAPKRNLKPIHNYQKAA